MNTLAVILEAPERLALRSLEMKPVEAADVLIEIAFSGISTGTEKLLWSGRMPPFPGLGYPLVPGYESVGRIVDAGPEARARIGDWVFVPGANCYTEAHGLFGGTAQRVIVPSARALPIPEHLGELFDTRPAVGLVFFCRAHGQGLAEGWGVQPVRTGRVRVRQRAGPMAGPHGSLPSASSQRCRCQSRNRRASGQLISPWPVAPGATAVRSPCIQSAWV